MSNLAMLVNLHREIVGQEAAFQEEIGTRKTKIRTDIAALIEAEGPGYRYEDELGYAYIQPDGERRSYDTDTVANAVELLESAVQRLWSEDISIVLHARADASAVLHMLQRAYKASPVRGGLRVK